MKIIVGLGNIGNRYENTRHNVGFRILDAYASSQSAQWQEKTKFKAFIAQVKHGDESIILIKPTTMYNLVGDALQRVAAYYDVDQSDILVIHDELMLPFGTVRTRIGGSDAGNNGLKSIHEHLGGETSRIRIGVYNELRDRINDADFVLSTFTPHERDFLPKITQHTIEFIELFLIDSFTPHTVTIDTTTQS